MFIYLAVYYMHKCVILSFIPYCIIIGSSAQPVSSQLFNGCWANVNSLRTSQIVGEIQQKDVSYLAACFDSVELYVNALELTPGGKTDIRLKKIDSITT